MPKVGLDRSKTGRAKGTPNKTTALLKDAIIAAATAAGRGNLIAYLTKQAKENPGPYMTLLGKVLPLQVNAAMSGTIKHDLSGLSDEKLTEIASILGSNPNLRGGKGRDSATGDQT